MNTTAERRLLTISRTSAIFAILFVGKFFSSGTLQQMHIVCSKLVLYRL